MQTNPPLSLSEIEAYDWRSGKYHKDTVALTYRVRALYNQLSTAQSVLVGTGGMRLSDALLWMLVMVGRRAWRRPEVWR